MKAINHKQKGFIGQTQNFQNITNICLSSKLSVYFTIEFPHTTMPRSHPTVLEDSFTISILSFLAHILLFLLLFLFLLQFGPSCPWQSVRDLHLKENISTSAIVNRSISALSLAPTLSARLRRVEELWEWKETRLAPTAADFLHGNSEGRLCKHT